jgi:hypothetical protein
VDWSAGVLGIVSGALFLESSGIRRNLSVTHERFLCVDHIGIHMVGDHTWIERGMRVACWSGFPLQGVHQFESPRLSDMSTVVCGSHHVDNLIGLISLSVIDVCCLLHLIACNSCLSRVGCNLFRNDLNRAKT